MSIATVMGKSSRAGIALATLSLVSGVVLLALSGWLITRASQQPPIMYLQMAIVGVRAFALGRAFFRYFGRLFSHDSAFRGLASIRRWAVERLVPLGPDGIVSVGRGSLYSSVVNDVDSMQELPLRVVEPLWAHGVTVVIALIAIGVVSPGAAGLAAGVFAASIIVALLIEHKSGERFARHYSELSGRIYDDVDVVVRNLDLLDAYDSRARYIERIRNANSQRVHHESARAIAQAVTSSLWLCVGGGLTVLLAVAHDVTDAPLYVALALVPLALVDVFAALPGIVASRKVVIESWKRLMRSIPDPVPREIPVDAERTQQLDTVVQVALSSVSARYPSASLDALHDVSFSADRGDIVLISGPSGSGKSTIAHVLVRFLEFRGNVTLNGVDIRKFSNDDVRDHIGLCEQTPHLFATTLRRNLDFANTSASDEELWAALDAVRLKEWAVARGGLDTELGARAELLSGGQAHRIALARNLLSDRDVIIVDEPTANLDSATSVALLEDFFAATRDRIAIIISHEELSPPRPFIQVHVE